MSGENLPRKVEVVPADEVEVLSADDMRLYRRGTTYSHSGMDFTSRASAYFDEKYPGKRGMQLSGILGDLDLVDEEVDELL